MSSRVVKSLFEICLKRSVDFALWLCII